MTTHPIHRRAFVTECAGHSLGGTFLPTLLARLVRFGSLEDARFGTSYYWNPRRRCESGAWVSVISTLPPKAGMTATVTTTGHSH